MVTVSPSTAVVLSTVTLPFSIASSTVMLNSVMPVNLAVMSTLYGSAGIVKV